MQKISGFQHGYDICRSLEFRVLIVFVFKYLNESEIQKMTIADCGFFLHWYTT